MNARNQKGGEQSQNRGGSSSSSSQVESGMVGMDRAEMAPRLCGLPPVGAKDPTILILGSFPSAASRIAGEYYANPRNQFWTIVLLVAGIPPGTSYPDRCQAIARSGITLWDMVSSCRQGGSADSTIRDPVLNDIPGFISSCPGVRLVVANGSLAGRLLTPVITDIPDRVRVQALPSTSPANARMCIAAKAAAWQSTIDPFLLDRISPELGEGFLSD